MIEPQGFRRQQRGVALAMAAAVVVTIIATAIGLMLDRTTDPPLFADRLQAVLRRDLFVVAWLAAAIANVARLRFLSPDDIAGSSAATATPAVGQAGAILRNTFEQVVLAILAHAMLAAALSRPAPLVTMLVALFCVGRLLFWVGYRRGPTGRAFGFALTFYPSIGALAVAAITIAMGP